MSDCRETFGRALSSSSLSLVTCHSSPGHSSAMRRISAICFDLDNTLWDVWPVIVRAEQEMYAFLQARYPRIAARYSVEALRAERERIVVDEPHMHHDFTYLRKASLKRCADAVGYCEPVAEEAFA